MTISDDDIVEPSEMITFTFTTLDPPAPQAKVVSNAMLVIQDNDGMNKAKIYIRHLGIKKNH